MLIVHITLNVRVGVYPLDRHVILCNHYICDTQMLQDHIPLCIALVVGAGMYILDIHKCYKTTFLCLNVRAGMYPLDRHVILCNHEYLRYINATSSHSFVPKCNIMEQR